jgi:hypothetical protein
MNLDVWQRKGLESDFSDVWQGKELADLNGYSQSTIPYQLTFVKASFAKQKQCNRHRFARMLEFAHTPQLLRRLLPCDRDS